jgi:ankyrin repeat protein
MIAFESALEAIMARDLPALEEIFEKYPELSKRDKNKKYPTDHEGRTLLYLAVGDKFEGLEGQAKKKAEEANFEITNFLINQNPSSVNQVRNNNNASPLFLATQNNKIDLIHLLLSLGADYQHKTRVKIGDKTQEITALELANKKSAAISIEMGQAIKLIKNTSPEKIYDCINHGFPFLIGKLIKDKKLSQEEIDRLLILMSRSRNFPMVQFLVDNGANINTFDPETGATPAMISSQQGDLKTLAFLVDAGINPKALTKIGHSILISALLPNLKLDVLKFLLSTGKFDPNYPANTENAFILLTTSHYPFSKDVEEAMSDLIAAGADVDFKLKNGDEIITPLSVASEIYDLRKVKFLLENSAHIKNQQSLKDFIIRYSKFPKTKLEAKEILSLIIDDARKHGVKIDINDQFTFENIKCTLLHCLVLITPKNITTIALLELGANPRIRSMFGIKPIDFVDKSKNEELYFYLYNYEKFLNIKDRLQKNLQDKITIKNADKETFSIELKFKNVTKLIKCNDEKSESKIITEIRSQLELLRVGNQ